MTKTIGVCGRGIVPVSLATAACLVLIAACSGPAPSKADLVGVWYDDFGGRLEFSEDGRVLAESPKKERREARWRLTVPAGRSAWSSPSDWDAWRISLQGVGKNSQAGTHRDIFYTRSHGEPVVLYPFGTPDVDRDVKFHKRR